MKILEIMRKSITLVFKTQSFLSIILGIFIVQFLESQNWLDLKLKNFSGFGWFVAFLVCLFFIDWIYGSKFYRLCKIRTITELDIFFIDVIIISLVDWGIFRYRGISNSNNIVFILFIASVLALIGIISRFYFIISSENKISELIELYDLQDLLNNPITRSYDTQPVLVDERSSSCDLFNRKSIIYQLKNAINIFSPKHSYVIGLIGRWGVGKTTVLKLTKKEIFKKASENIVFIHAPGEKDQDFDLWLFGSQEQLIKGFYDTFMCNLGAEYTSSIGEDILKKGSQVLTGVPKIGDVLGLFTSNFGSYYDVNKIKTKLTRYVKSTGKHYVMCIENLDRAEDTQVILLLKLINTIFDLPYVTYVLLYDKDRLNNILENTDKLNISYADKVINQEIEVPETINQEACLQVLRNLLTTYGITKKEIEDEYNYVLKEISNNLKDIRELKRIINSIFPILAIKNNLRLNLPQVLAIQYIQFTNKKLYEEIRTHKNIFLFKLNYYNQVIDFLVDENSEEYLKSLLSSEGKNYNYIPLLDELFLKVKLFEDNRSKSCTREFVDEKLKIASIDTQKYFDNYFLLSENNYIQINAETRSFIKKINDVSKSSYVSAEWKKYIANKTTVDKEDYSLELTLFLTKQDIKSSLKREILAEAMWCSINDYYNEEYWNSLSKERIIQCIVYLIGEVSEREFNQFKYFILGYHNTLFEINYMINLMKERVGSIPRNLKKYTKEFEVVYQQLCKIILDSKNKINLYNSTSYDRRNIWGLLEYEDQDKVEEYIGRCINQKTVYYIITDALKYTGQGNEEIIGGIFAKAFKKYQSKIDKAFKSGGSEDKTEKMLHDKYLEFIKQKI